jgi:hypothetical protein
MIFPTHQHPLALQRLQIPPFSRITIKMFLRSALRGIVFMGTSHRGSSLSMLGFAKHLPWSDRIALLASEDVDELSFYPLSEKSVIEQQKLKHAKLKRWIEKRKHELVKLNYRFLKLFHASKGKSTSTTAATVGEFIIRNFVESASVAWIARIVRPGDADLRYPGEDYEWFQSRSSGERLSHCHVQVQLCPRWELSESGAGADEHD